jgi:hypothetical protein
MLTHHQDRERAALPESLGPWTVDGLASDVHRHALADRWLWATTAICFLQELLFCIDDGGIHPSKRLGAFTDEVQALVYLRNVIAHPANLGADATSAKEFCYRMDRDPEFQDFSTDLMENWSLFARDQVTRFALRRLNTAGRAYARQLGLFPQRT